MEAPSTPQRGLAHGEAKDKERCGASWEGKGQEEVEDGVGGERRGQ